MNDMTKVKNLTFISCYENLAPDDYCDKMIEAWERIYANASLREHGADGTITNVGMKNRKDFALFFDEERYDLSAVGRVKLNMRLDQEIVLLLLQHKNLQR